MVTKSDIATYFESRPGTFGGKPIIRGKRIAVELVVGWVEAGIPIEEILEDYPLLTREEIEAAVAFAVDEAVRTEIRRW